MAAEYAELHVYDPTGTTMLCILPVEGLQWSDEVGGTGGVSFTAYAAQPQLVATPDLLDDCVVKVAVPLATGAAPTEVAAFAVRNASKEMLGERRTVKVSSAPTLLTVWAQDAVVRPEFAGANMPRKAGKERGFGWQSSTYDPDDDPTVWDRLIETDKPVPYQWTKGGITYWQTPRWPENASVWVTIPESGNPEADGDRVLYRAWFTTTDDVTVVRLYFSADEASTVWLGGEVLFRTTETETGRRSVQHAERTLVPGTYAVGVDTEWVDSGPAGDGDDAVIFAVAQLDADGDPETWLLRSSDTTTVAAQLPPSGTGSEPPGPTVGAVLLTLTDEATTRGVSTWGALTPDFTATNDSDDEPWPEGVERIFRYAYDTYGHVIAALADEGCDCRVLPDLTLQARVFEGSDLSGTVRLAVGRSLLTLDEQIVPPLGSVVDVETLAGWATVSDATAVADYGRREFGLPLGSVSSIRSGQRIAARALVEQGRRRSDGTAEFVAAPGAVPYQDFRVGDTITVVGIDGSSAPRRVLSLSATDGAPVRWSVELGEPNV